MPVLCYITTLLEMQINELSQNLKFSDINNSV